MAKSKGKKSKKDESTDMNHLKTISLLIEKFGISTVIVAFLITYIFLFASADQKQELIDVWLLFKSENSNIVSAIWFIIFGLIIVTHNRFYVGKIKLYKARLEDAVTEKTRLQEELLKRSLSSSK